MATTAAPAGNNNAAAASQQNMTARNIVVGNAVDLTQQIFSQTYTNYVAGQSYPINITPRNVGLLKRFWVECSFTVQQGAAETQTKTVFGGANALSQIIFTDLNNQVRVSTTGWHLHLLATARRPLAFGALLPHDVLGPPRRPFAKLGRRERRRRLRDLVPGDGLGERPIDVRLLGVGRRLDRRLAG